MTRLVVALVVVASATNLAAAQDSAKKPNVILIIADDMGHGDLGIHGNPKIKTPNLDKLGKNGVRMKHFYVSPVCSPTRASLLTGRYNYRTGVVDTFIGRSMMHPDEVTLAELLRAAGYRTGIFGKWHLGDCFPMRAMDQGFDESLVLRGGGIGQPSDPPGGGSYFDPVLQHNGKQVKTKGYCSDVYTDAAIDFIAKNKAGPFFVYLPFNAPHDPLQLPESYEAPYRKMDLGFDQFPKIGQPLQGKADQDKTAKVYGMVTNIDDNVGRVMAKLKEWGIEDNTIVIFLTDNGPQHARYNSGMRGRKGTVHEGGTRVPFFVSWPGRLQGDREIDRIAAHIDVTPTLLDACGVKRPEKAKIDGVSLMPLWLGEKVEWPNRMLYFQWHRGDIPQLFRACAVRNQQYRLVQPEGVAEKGPKADGPFGLDKKWMLFDIEKDPFEMKDLAEEQADVVNEMRDAYMAWFKEMQLTRGFQHPRIVLGAKEAPVQVLTRQDWRGGQRTGWSPKDLGHWDVSLPAAAKFDVTVHLPEGIARGSVNLRFKEKLYGKKFEGNKSVTFLDVVLPEGEGRFEAWAVVNGFENRGVSLVEVRRKE